MTGAAKNTITKLLVELDVACSAYGVEAMRNLSCRQLECDEVWAFRCAREKNVPGDLRGQFGYGDVYTWTAICADTKLTKPFA